MFRPTNEDIVNGISNRHSAHLSRISQYLDPKHPKINEDNPGTASASVSE